MKQIACIISCLALLVWPFNPVASANADDLKHQSEQKKVRAAFNRFWYGVRMTNLQIIERSVHFPFSQMNVRHHKAGQVLVLSNPNQLRAKFMDIQSDSNRGLKIESQHHFRSFEISKMRVVEDGMGAAYVTFMFTWGEKIPFRLMTALQKYGKNWKVVFTQVPS